MEESLEMREENEEPSVPEMRNSVYDRDKLQVSTHMFHVSCFLFHIYAHMLHTSSLKPLKFKFDSLHSIHRKRGRL